MKIVVVGSVAAGTSVAAKARRNNENAQITVFEQDADISYAICGIPYYLGGEVDSLEVLTPRDAAWFKSRFNIDIATRHRVLSIDKVAKTVVVKNLANEKTWQEPYDVLVLATGATPLIPKALEAAKASKNCFAVRTIQSAQAINQFIEEENPRKAIVLGAGMIGLEMAEQLYHKGLQVTLVQRNTQVLSPMDEDMALYIEQELSDHNISVLTGVEVYEAVLDKQGALEKLLLSSGQELSCDFLVVATGVRPQTQLAQQAGIALGKTGAIQVNGLMQTSEKSIYAVGDVAESYSPITQNPLWRPLGSTANKMGRIAGDAITGGNNPHRGVLGTGIVRVFSLTAAFTGLNSKQAKAEGFDIETAHIVHPDHADYLGGQEYLIKAIADKKTGRLLGAQSIGVRGVDKSIDVLATAISFGAKVEDLFHLDLAYAPPFSNTKDAVHYLGMALDNALAHNTPLITPQQLYDMQEQGKVVQIVDTRSKREYEKSHISGAIHMPLEELRSRWQELEKEHLTVTYCNKGITGNAAQNLLRNLGFSLVYNLSGGMQVYQGILHKNTAYGSKK